MFISSRTRAMLSFGRSRVGDLEVGRGHGERVKPVMGEHALGGSVFQPGVRVHPVQAEPLEGDLDDVGQRGAREALAIVRLAHPEANGRRLSGAPGNVIEVYAPDELALLVNDGEWHHDLTRMGLKGALQVGPLRRRGEEVLGALRPRVAQELAIRGEHGQHFLGVVN
jgi:hypothetical protein